MKLGIVGHGQEKFTHHTEALARMAIDDAIARHKPTHLVSGHSPMGGVDWYAEDAAEKHNLRMVVHAPRVQQWGAPGGYKDRNLAIANDSDVVLVVVVEQLPPGFKGMRFAYCYHCRGKEPGVRDHIKSGGCWTARHAKAAEWAVIGKQHIYYPA